ncbi:MAG TPA: SDR family oxidoreductase [Nitrospira sp.]|nr:SDR family oxidoreductase [Nitrospira sp.]
MTGASGFVGRALAECLAARGDIVVRGGFRTLPVSPVSPGIEVGLLGELGSRNDWESVLGGVDLVVHCAARVHVMRETAVDPLGLYRQSNTQGTIALGWAAAACGCKRFVFLSSIKVNGEETRPGFPYTEEDPPAPADLYSLSKLEAEEGLREVALQTGMEVVIVRPPLVYGQGVKANFSVMMRWLEKEVPLPLGGVRDNARSFVALDNLVDFLETCLFHPAAANQVFLVSDGEDLSTAELLIRTARAMGTRARLIPVPTSLLRATGRILGRSESVRRLCGSLQVDIGRARRLLGWMPPIGVDEGLRRATRREGGE